MKKKIFKIFTAVLSLLLIMSMVAGCSSEKTDDDDTIVNTAKPEPEDLVGQITLSGYVQDANDDHLSAYISAFNSQYNNVDVTVIHDDFADTYFAELDNRINEGLIGDVFLIDSERMAKYAAEGKIIDLSPYVQNYIDFDSYETINPSEELYKAAYEASLYDGKMYMGATEYYHNFVFVNYSMLEKVGMSKPHDNYTWDELLAAASKIKTDLNIANPIVMDYEDYSIWGSFARGYQSDIYSNIGNSETLGMTFTDPGVIRGLEYLSDEIVASGLVYKASADTINAEDLSKYAFVVADHTNIAFWNEYLNSDKCDFDWDYTHFPTWADEWIDSANVTEGTFSNLDALSSITKTADDEEITYKSKVNRSVGSTTYGLAVYNHNDDEHDATHYAMCAQLALYGLVDNGAEEYVGKGETVPANKAIAAKRFWRDFPVSGKNSSVFTHYADYNVVITAEGTAVNTEIADFAGSLTSFMTIDAAKSVDMGKIINDYLNNKVPFAVSLQNLQDTVNKKMK